MKLARCSCASFQSSGSWPPRRSSRIDGSPNGAAPGWARTQAGAIRLASSAPFVLSRSLNRGEDADGANENRDHRHWQDRAGPALAGHRQEREFPPRRRRQPARPRRRGVPSFKTPDELYAAVPDVDAVAICTPPHVRHAIAREALAAGKHVMLEKPPAATVAEMHDLTRLRAPAGRVIFATWHSQYNAAVDAAKARLAGQKIAQTRDRMERGRAPLASRPGMDLGRRQFRRVRSRHQRALDPDQDRARRDVREIGAARISRKSRHADRGFAGLLLQRRPRGRDADRRIRLASAGRPELEHRHRDAEREPPADAWRLATVHRRRTGSRRADGRI